MRIDQLTFTRFIAAVLIVIFHFGESLFLFTNDCTSFFFKHAYIGVSYFFVLSGFVMIIAYHKKDRIPFFEFLKNRLARIYPIYFLAIFLLVRTAFFSNVTDTLLNVFMIQSWIPGKALTINFPGWSLSVELFFYVLFPLLITNFYRKASFGNCLLIVLLFWIVSQVLVYLTIQTNIIQIPFYTAKDLVYHPVLHLNAFLLGNVAGLYFVRNPKSLSKSTILPIVGLVILLLLILKLPSELTYYNGLLAILFAPLVFFIAQSDGSIAAFFSKKVFVFLGEVSFGVYIYQWPVWNIVSDYKLNKYFGFDKDADYTTTFLIRLLLLIFISSISYLYFEKPLRNWIKNRKISA